MQVMRVNMQSGVAKTAKPQISVTEAGKIGRARGGEGGRKLVVPRHPVRPNGNSEIPWEMAPHARCLCGNGSTRTCSVMLGVQTIACSW